jgi:ATP synthase subunit 6
MFSTWNFSPLEQFDSFTYTTTAFFFEAVNLYTFYIFEIEYSVQERLQHSFESFIGLPLYWENSKLFLIVFVLALVYGFRQLKQIQNNFLILEDFSHLFFGLVFSLFLPNIFDFVFTTVPFVQENLSYLNFFRGNVINVQEIKPLTNFNFEVLPQIHFSLFFDENFISFLLAFFLLGGSEDEEDEDFLLEEEESDFIDDVVAPLFLANLGKEVEGNGELLIKVSNIFSFVLINNLMGMLPYSDTGTSSLMLTFWVALSIFVSLLTLMIRKQGIAFFFGLFMPSGCPLPLIFLLIPIEFISYSFRLVSLSVRLFANMMAGHTLLKVIVGFSFSMILMGDSMLLVNLFPIAVLFILTFLEVGVAVIQAYIFTILTCIYLKDIYVAH